MTKQLALALGMLAVVSTGATPSPQATPGVTLTFIANEGVLLAGGGRKVLIDALFRAYDGYPVAPDSVQTKLVGALAPFDSVNLVLTTHYHGDHFHPAQVAQHMRANPAATFLASRQVMDSLSARVPAAQIIPPRYLPRELPLGARSSEVVNGVPVEILRVKHHNLQHFAYIVDLGGRRVFHAGDTDGSADVFAPFRLDTARIDLALLPPWFMERKGGAELVDKWIKPRHVAVIHLGEADREIVIRRVAPNMPLATVLGRPGEVRSW